MTGVRLIAGLGNPGPEYLRNRHNAGFWFADVLATGAGQRFGFENRLHAETCRLPIGGEQVRVIKPGTFMNESGRAIVAALNYWKLTPDELLVVHDDLDLPPGAARLKFDGGTAARTACATSSRSSGTESSTASASASAIRGIAIA